MPESKRVFLAIKINTSKNFMDTIDGLKLKLKHENIRWINTGNLHLTLRFFGDTPIYKIDGIVKAIKNALEKEKEFKIVLQKLGVFGSRYNPKVIWFKVLGDEILKELEVKISTELEAKGFFGDRQNFVPHLTIARLKRLKDKKLFNDILEDYKEIYIQESEVKEVVLYESILNNTGAEYKILQKFDLKA